MKKIVLSALLLVAPSVMAVNVILPDDGLYRCGVESWEQVGKRVVKTGYYGMTGYVSIDNRAVSVKFRDVNISFSPVSKLDSGRLMAYAVDTDQYDIIISAINGKTQYMVSNDNNPVFLNFSNCIIE
ncbi:hypothetical protein ABL325_004701 [Escherichia coli]